MAEVYSFDVTFSSHDLLQEGITEAREIGDEQTWHRVLVSAESEQEASLLAAQMICARGWMCTGTYLRV